MCQPALWPTSLLLSGPSARWQCSHIWGRGGVAEAALPAGVGVSMQWVAGQDADWRGCGGGIEVWAAALHRLTHQGYQGVNTVHWQQWQPQRGLLCPASAMLLPASASRCSGTSIQCYQPFVRQTQPPSSPLGGPSRVASLTANTCEIRDKVNLTSSSIQSSLSLSLS